MKFFSIIVFIALVTVLNAGISSTIIQRDGYFYSNTIPRLLAGCTKLNKTTTFDDQNPSIQNITYTCLECSQAWNNQEKLALVKLVNGSQRCIRKFFISEGCQQYDHLLYTSYWSGYLDNQDQDENVFRKPFTCGNCPTNSGYRIIKKSAIDYPQDQLYVESIDMFSSYDEFRQYFHTDIYGVQYCIKQTNLVDGCISFSGKSNLANQNDPVSLPEELLNQTTKVCNLCSEGFTLSSGCTLCDQTRGYMRSVQKPWTCVLKTPNCADYQNTDSCKVCSTGYLLNNSRCDNCSDGFRYSDLTPGACVAAVPDCVVYTNDVCIECIPEKKLQNGQCQNCSTGFRRSDIDSSICVAEIMGCASYVNDTCQSCSDGYVLNTNENVCTKTVQYCSLYVQGVCQQCLPGYDFPSDTNKTVCQVQTTVRYCKLFTKVPANRRPPIYPIKCSKCQPGYHLKQDFTLCYKDIDFCAVNLDRICLQCEYGYYLNSKTKRECLPNPTCPADTTQWNYEIISGKCVKIDPNCRKYTSTGQCKKCKTHYRLENSKCIFISLNEDSNSEDSSSSKNTNY